MRISIINWTGDRKNWGCQATSFGLLADIKDALEGREFVPHFVPLGGKTAPDRVVKRLFWNFLWRYLGEPVHSKSANRLFARLTRWIYAGHMSELERADAVLFMAEGTMTGQGFFESVRLLMLPYYVSTQMGKPVISLNQTIFTKRDEFVHLLQSTYRTFHSIDVREPASLAYAHKIGLTGADLFPDSAFRTRASGAEIAKLLDPAPTADILCITASGGYPGSYKHPYAREAARICREHGIQPVGLFWQPGAMEALRELCKEEGGLPPVFPKAGIPYTDVSEILSKSVAVVGGRYHTAIQAAAVHTPFVATRSGSHKTAGLLQMLDYPFPERHFEDVAGVREDLLSIIRNRTDISNHLAIAVERVEDLRKRGIERLRANLLSSAKLDVSAV